MKNSVERIDAPSDSLVESIVSLTRTLIAIPSQGGIDDPEPICKCLNDWLQSRDVPSRILYDNAGHPIGVSGELGDRHPTYCLNACLDTAPVGDPRSWSMDPFGGEIEDGWLYGRGSADCKAAVALFCHIALEAKDLSARDGTLALLFDADEHTGRFGGVKTYVGQAGPVAGVMIGYPGNYGVVVGARGFCRLRIEVLGTSEHSGSKDTKSDNAIVKSAEIVQRLRSVVLPVEKDAEFSFGPKLTVTEIHGGRGFSVVPDMCTIGVDLRLTPSFGESDALELVRKICTDIDKEFRNRKATNIYREDSWPPYRLSGDSKVVRALRESAQDVFDRSLPCVVAGPSNIGNYLAHHKIEATCGFGVTYRHLHAPDEAIDISTLAPVLETYEGAVRRLIGAGVRRERPSM